MKTLKELLIKRHRAAEPGLDQARKEFLARLGSLQTPLPRERRGFEHLWREYFLPLRWHLAGMSAAWLMVLLLNADTSPAPTSRVAKANRPTPQQVAAAVREKRQELLDLMGAPPVAAMPLPPRRSEILPSIALA